MRRKILDQNGLNFLTMTIVEWIDLFTRPAYCDIIIDSLKFCQKEKGLNVYAFVIMSNHIHLVVDTDSEKGLSSIIQRFKSFTTNQVMEYLNDYSQIESRREWLKAHFKCKKKNIKSENQIWQKSNYPVSLFSPKVIKGKIIYIHENPVETRRVREAHHYVYSSASNYVTGSGVLDVIVLDDVWFD